MRSSRQKRSYSGKKKRHTHKVHIVIDADTRRIICVHFERGNCHDFQLYKNSKLRLHPGICQKVDSGYQGADKLHLNTQLPKKKTKKNPLTKEHKRANRQHAKERIPVEHINAKAKVFKLLENRYRSHSRF